MTPTTSTTSAQLLLDARSRGGVVHWRDILPASLADAYATQDATLAQIGPIGGWKVGAKGPQAEPSCAPLPLACLLPTGVRLTGAAWQLRGIEVEVALRVGRDLDLDPHGPVPSQAELAAAFDAVLPVIEVVESRLADREGSDPLCQVADLLSHGALVLGAPSALPPAQLDLRMLAATQSFDGQVVADTVGGNPAADVWHLLGWLALHCAQRGQPLRRGQIVTTGSCTGMLSAPAGARVQGQVAGVGVAEVQF